MRFLVVSVLKGWILMHDRLVLGDFQQEKKNSLPRRMKILVNQTETSIFCLPSFIPDYHPIIK